jgi:hypothetical protein
MDVYIYIYIYIYMGGQKMAAMSQNTILMLPEFFYIYILTCEYIPCIQKLVRITTECEVSPKNTKYRML